MLLNEFSVFLAQSAKIPSPYKATKRIGVYSLFRYDDEDLAISPVLDDLVNEGWELYWNEVESILVCMYTTSVFKQTQRQS